jgi:hypothetical protein
VLSARLTCQRTNGQTVVFQSRLKGEWGMADRQLLSSREQARGLLLAQRQPQSTPALQELVERVRSRAIASVLSDSHVRERLQQTRYRVVGADWREEKPLGHGESERHVADVGLYDYDRNVLVVAVVDLRAGRVERIEERPGQQPPPAEEEVAEATELVLASDQFHSLRQQQGLQVVALPARAASIPDHRRHGHRVFMLTLWTAGDQPTRLGEAAVDLSSRALVPVDEADPLSGAADPSQAPEQSRTRR